MTFIHNFSHHGLQEDSPNFKVLLVPCPAWKNANFGLEDFQQMQFRASFQKLELNGGVLVQVQVQVSKSECLSLIVGVINFRLK